MEDIKPIETVYNGYRFRSRLEARWAVFFDSIGINWLYEPEGIQLPDGSYYLPDFYLPDCKQFFEVKGVMDDPSLGKAKALIAAGHSVTIGYNDGEFIACNHWPDSEGSDFELCEDSESVLAQCWCGKYWFMGIVGVWDCQNCGAREGDHHWSTIMESKICRGIRKSIGNEMWNPARRARFEHGETPKVRRTNEN